VRKIVVLALAAAASAQEFPDFTAAMKASNTAFDALRKMESKTGKDATSAAERLAGIYENMIPFWRQRNAEQAVEWSEQGKSAGVQLASAANAGDAQAAAAAFKTLSGTCRSCHDAYRARVGEGKYRIK
jgi:cytochrome c556